MTESESMDKSDFKLTKEDFETCEWEETINQCDRKG